MDVGDDTTASDGCLDERVELLVAADRELEVLVDALDLKVLGRVARELENLGGQVFMIAVAYTAEVAPTRCLSETRCFKYLWIRPTGN